MNFEIRRREGSVEEGVEMPGGSGEESGGKTTMRGKECSELIGNRCSED